MPHVRELLTELIDDMHPGDPLPAERELATRFEVSRMTLRKAVDELANAGQLIRRHRAGTFVTGPKVAQPLTATSFTDDMRARGLTPRSRTLTAATHLAGPLIARRLAVSPETSVQRVRRLRLAEQEPMALEDLYIPAVLVPGLTGQDLVDSSFYTVLAQRYGLRVATGIQVLEPTVTDADESGLLDVPRHSPAFLFERTSQSADGTVLEYVRSIYRGDRYRLVTSIRAAGERVQHLEHDGAPPE